MDVALCIEKLVPAANYGGSTTTNTKTCYDELRWEDKREKPSSEELKAVSDSVNAEWAEKMSKLTLEERIAELENEITELKK